VAVLQTKLAQAELPARPQFLDECSEHTIAGAVLYRIYNTPPVTSPPSEPSRCSISARFGSCLSPRGPGSIPLAHQSVSRNRLWLQHF
jgi:hypothetical protein